MYNFLTTADSSESAIFMKGGNVWEKYTTAEKINYDRTATLCNTVTPGGLIVTWMR